MVYLDNYEAYSHSNAPTDPIGDENGNIIGLELEISELHDNIFLEELITDGTISCWNSADSGVIQLEEEAQGNVEYELIFNADSIENIFKRLDYIKELRHDVTCNEDSSCHIHLNRRYLYDVLDLNELDIYHAADAIAPLIYKVSGRDSRSWNQWTPEHIDLFNRDLINRFELIDDIKPRNNGDYNDRYELCNCTNNYTIEIRGFSNFYEFDIGVIKFYIKIVSELIPEIAAAMKNKTYAADYEIVFKKVSSFLNNYPHYVERFELQEWTNYKAALRKVAAAEFEKAITEYHAVIELIKECRYYQETDAPNAARKITEIIAIYRFIKLDIIDLNDIKATIDSIEEQNQKHFKNAVWRV